MSAVPVTDRELRKAWKELSSVWGTTPLEKRHNPHRLLLFYAVECGLKAIWLKRHGRTLFSSADIEETGHDLRGLLKDLRLGKSCSLPENLNLREVKIENHGQVIPRNGGISLLHQAWRYGMQCVNPTDEQLTQHLENVLEWIAGELK